MISVIRKLADLQTSHLSAPKRLTVCQILSIDVDIDATRTSAGDEDAPLLQGMRDFLSLEPGKRGRKEGNAQLELSAPSRLVRTVLRICRLGGMTHAGLGAAMGKHDTGQAWARYFTNRQQMRTAKLRALVDEAQRRGWLDRKRPTLPHPIDLKWGSSQPNLADESIQQWAIYESPSAHSALIERISAVEACVVLARDRQEITQHAVRQVALVDLDLTKKNRRHARGHAQRSRRAREEFGDSYWVKILADEQLAKLA